MKLKISSLKKRIKIGASRIQQTKQKDRQRIRNYQHYPKQYKNCACVWGRKCLKCHRFKRQHIFNKEIGIFTLYVWSIWRHQRPQWLKYAYPKITFRDWKMNIVRWKLETQAIFCIFSWKYFIYGSCRCDRKNIRHTHKHTYEYELGECKLCNFIFDFPQFYVKMFHIVHLSWNVVDGEMKRQR